MDSPGAFTGKILVVEDDTCIRNLVCTMLRQSGYEVIAAADGREALERCNADIHGISLVLTDLVMPLMGGNELARYVKQLKPEVAVVFMSGYSDEELLLDAAALGDGFLRKPFTGSDLTGAVRAALYSPHAPTE